MKNAASPATDWDFTMQNGGLTPSRCWKPQSRLLKTLIFRVTFIYIYTYKYAGLNRSLPLLGPNNCSKPVVTSTISKMDGWHSKRPQNWSTWPHFAAKDWSHKNAKNPHAIKPTKNPSEKADASLSRQSDGTSCKDLVRVGPSEPRSLPMVPSWFTIITTYIMASYDIIYYD